MNSGASEPVLVGLDWGTSSLRAFLIGANGDVVRKLESPRGVMRAPGGDFEAAFDALVGPWLAHKPLPVLASGMITSRNGWVETPYIGLPLGASDLAQALVRHRTFGDVEIRFVAGGVTERATGPDVMRGEETQIVGAVATGADDGLFVMPGTHSKWVSVTGGRTTEFSTYMTGEVFAALKDATILGALIEEAPFNAAGFERGVAAGLRDGANLLRDLFQARSLPLMGRIDGSMVGDYLSGLLIGDEVKAELGRGRDIKGVTIVGRTDLADRYERALRLVGVTTRRTPEDIAAKGHFAIARSAGLIA